MSLIMREGGRTVCTQAHHSRPQRPRSFWPATGIETSGDKNDKPSGLNVLVYHIKQGGAVA